MTHTRGFSHGRVAQLFRVLSHPPKGCRFDSWPGHIPKLCVQCLVRVHREGNWSMFLSHMDDSLSSPHPSEINKYILGWGLKRRRGRRNNKKKEEKKKKEKKKKEGGGEGGLLVAKLANFFFKNRTSTSGAGLNWTARAELPELCSCHLSQPL